MSLEGRFVSFNSYFMWESCLSDFQDIWPRSGTACLEWVPANFMCSSFAASLLLQREKLIQSSKKVALGRLKEWLSPSLQSWFSRVSAFHWALKPSKNSHKFICTWGSFPEKWPNLWNTYRREKNMIMNFSILEKYDQEFQSIEKYNPISFWLFSSMTHFFSTNHCWSCVVFIPFLTSID